MENIIITEWNRDNAKLWFEPVENEDNMYTIHTDDKHKYILEYACINYDNLPDDSEDYDIIYDMPDGRKVKTRTYSYDPAGGPFMPIGYEVGGKILERIFRKDNKMYFKLV